MNDLFIYIAIFIPLIPISIGVRGFQKLDISAKIIVGYLLIAFSNDLLCLGLARNGIPNLLFINLFGLFQGTILILFFRYCDQKFYKNLYFLAIIYVMVYLFVALIIEGIDKFDGIAMTIEALIMLILCLTFFYNVYANEITHSLEGFPSFWIVIGILIYFSGALYSFMLGADMLAGSNDKFYNSWILHNMSGIIKNILFAIGLWKAVSR